MLKIFPWREVIWIVFASYEKFFSYHMLLEFGGLSSFFFFKTVTTCNSSSGDQPGEKSRNESLENHSSACIPCFSFRNNCVYLQILYPMCCVFCNSYYLIKHQICICNHNHIYYIKYVSI